MLQTIHEPLTRRQTPSPRKLTPFALGFRPFYWLAGSFAVVSMLLWMAMYLAGWAWQGGLPGVLWHAHEMIFGFGLAVVAGFLMTAVRAWTGLPTPTGAPLAIIAGIWLMARIGAFAGPLWLAASLDTAWLAWVAIALARVLQQANNRRNIFVPILLTVFALLNLAFYSIAAGWLPLPAVNALSIVLTALLLVTVLIAIIGGRVIQMFTQNATGMAVPRHPAVDRIAVASLLATALLAAAPLPGPLFAGLCVLTATVHALRLWQWRPGITWRKPILWILHVSYAWIPLGVALLGLAALHLFPAALAWHALAIGALSGMIIGMMTRTARGHTGRPLQVGKLEIAAYGLVHAAGIVRVFLPALAPAHTALWIGSAAALWVSAFACYLIVHTPILWRPRVDGKPG